MAKTLQNKLITECESCKRFFDDESMTQIQVRRSESETHFHEMWCIECLGKVDKVLDLKTLSNRIVSILFARGLIKDSEDPVVSQLETAIRNSLGGKL